MKKLIGVALILLLLVGIPISIISWYTRSIGPVNNESNATQNFIIPKGYASEQIAKKLVDQNLIHSEIAFKVYIARHSLSKKLQAGSFTLSQSMALDQIVEELTSGSEDVWITILEGWRREEIAESLEKTITNAGGNFNSSLFLDLTLGKEGYLFPDTYLIPIAMSEESIIALLENTLDKKIASAPEISASTRSLKELLTMASLIEREAKTSQSRKMVSGILWNRIDGDWPLQVDATLQYAKGFSSLENDWWSTPLSQDKEIDSPYNTYKYPGLPPGPISTVSLDSIIAAADPTPSDYWYYITGNDGKMYYATTLDEHNQNIRNHLR